jgi:pimeloyl-ACP methyl ester carboxylesterase
VRIGATDLFQRVILTAVVLSLTLFGGCRRHYAPDPAHDVDIVARDFVVLKASYFSPGNSGPGILLLHQCNMDRHAWDALTPDLVRAGFHVLTFDQRGFGETAGSRVDQTKALSDAEVAYDYLRSKHDVDKSRMAAGGASCGVESASALARTHAEIKTLLLLSGAASDTSKAYLTATPSLAVFGAADDRSGSDAADIQDLVKASHHPRSTARIVRGRAHGVAMFDVDDTLKPSMVKWLTARFSTDVPERGR